MIDVLEYDFSLLFTTYCMFTIQSCVMICIHFVINVLKSYKQLGRIFCFPILPNSSAERNILKTIVFYEINIHKIRILF